MSMVKPSPLRTVEENTLSPDSELIQVAKAVRDEVLDATDKKLQKELQSSLKSLESNVITSIVKSLDGEKDRHADELEMTVRLTKSIGQAYSKHFEELNSVVKGLGIKLAESENRADRMESIFEKCLEGMAKSYEMNYDRLVETIKMMPMPEVHVSIPSEAIQINQLPSIVNLPEGAIQITQSTPTITIPKDSIMVNVTQHPSIVNLPKDVIKVQVNQTAAKMHFPKDAIKVNVEHKTILEKSKGKTMVEKSILYDPVTGRPAKIMEETTEE